MTRRQRHDGPNIINIDSDAATRTVLCLKMSKFSKDVIAVFIVFGYGKSNFLPYNYKTFLL